jgi:hypothetical protein
VATVHHSPDGNEGDDGGHDRNARDHAVTAGLPAAFVVPTGPVRVAPPFAAGRCRSARTVSERFDRGRGCRAGANPSLGGNIGAPVNRLLHRHIGAAFPAALGGPAEVFASVGRP